MERDGCFLSVCCCERGAGLGRLCRGRWGGWGVCRWDAGEEEPHEEEFHVWKGGGGDSEESGICGT